MRVHRDLVVGRHNHCYREYATVTFLSSVELRMLLSTVLNYWVWPWKRNSWFICIVIDVIFSNVVNSINIFRPSYQVPDIYVGVLTKFESFRQVLQNYPLLNVTQIHLVGAEVKRRTERQTVRQTDGQTNRRTNKQTDMTRAAGSGFGRWRNFWAPEQKRTG
jgi:ABC-type enterochelin transport system permease subunit